MPDVPRVSRVRRSTAQLLTLALVAATVVVVTVGVQGSRARAAGAAPTSPKPQCVYSESGTPGRGCLPGQQGGSVSGTFAAGGEFTVTTEGGGLAPCYTYVSSGCYF